MKEYLLPDGRRRFKYYYKGPDGPTNIKGTLENANPTIAEITKFKAALIEKAEKRSLKSQVALFEDILDRVLQENGGAGMKWIYERVRRELAGAIDNTFASRYHRYIDKLTDEGKSVNTISNHKSVIRRVLNCAWKREAIDKMPIRDFSIKAKFRSRVLSIAERNRLESALLGFNKLGKKISGASYLFWSIYLAERRPIRKGDLWNLTSENYKRVGEEIPHLRYKAQKTGLDTIVPIIDMPALIEYLENGIPRDCPFLFPRLSGHISEPQDFDSMRASTWYKIEDPRHHFDELLETAEIENFHFHDFKRIATTYMLDHGYTAEELIDMGFYSSRKMIDLCYKKRNAMTVLKRVKADLDRTSIGLSIGPGVKNVANL